MTNLDEFAAEWHPEHIAALTEGLNTTFAPHDPITSVRYDNPSIAYHFSVRDNSEVTKLSELMAAWKQRCLEQGSDFPDTYYKCKITESGKFTDVSFQFASPAMGVGFFEQCGDLMQGILQGDYKKLSVERFSTILRIRPDLKPFDASRYKNAGAVPTLAD